MSRQDKAFIPLEYVGPNLGFNEDESEQGLLYPRHCNVPTRITWDHGSHDLRIEHTEGGTSSIVFVPKVRPLGRQQPDCDCLVTKTDGEFEHWPECRYA